MESLAATFTLNPVGKGKSMKSFTYNDMTFSLEPAVAGWNIVCQRADSKPVYVAAGLFAGLSEAEAEDRALALVKTAFPVGVRIVGPDVAHPSMVGDLKIIGPDVVHPNFIYWDKESLSCPQHI